jgi:hypothetical protein
VRTQKVVLISAATTIVGAVILRKLGKPVPGFTK